MKKLFYFIIAAVFAAGCSEAYDDSALTGRVDNLEDRVSKLEILCSQMNTNISSLQTLVNALSQNDYITNVAPISRNGEEVGYTITFKSGKTITIYHGEDGKDGEDGADGKDGINGENGADGKDGKDGLTPIIGVKLFNGVYYWTLNGEWLLDDDGNKIKAVGTDGKDGQNGADGEDGKDGQNGADGKDGITPQLKIEEGYWYISYDNGTSWKQLGKATGENGKDGQNGIDGKNGDSFFKNIRQDDNNLYLTLADGTELTLPLVSSYLFNRLQSVSFVPYFNDGAAPVYIPASGVITASYVEMSFEISPKDTTEEIVDSWNDILSIQAVNTVTRATKFIDLPVTQCVGDVNNGVITVRASGENLGEDFFEGTTTFSARLGISDGNTDIKSEYVPLIATELAQPNNEIWYTATEHIGYFMYEESLFGSKIVSHTFDEETGAGVITFEQDLISLNSAIRGRDALLTLSLPNSVTELGELAIGENRNMTAVKLGKGLKVIGEQAFFSCESLLDVKIPDGVTTIGNSAFHSCFALESVSIPKSVTTIGKNAFNWCQSLKSLTIPSGVKRLEESVAMNCESLTELVLSEGLNYIGVLAFAGCNLNTVTIPSTVAEMGNMCFYGNENLATVYCKPTTAPILGGAVFDETLIWLPRNNATRCGVIYVPSSSYDGYVASESWETYAVYAPVYQDAQILHPYNFTE